MGNNNCSLIPNSNSILCTLVEPDETTEGGLFIPQGERDTGQARVVSIGSKVMDYDPGDLVVVGKFSGTQFQYAGVTYHIFREDEVLVRVDDGDD